MSEQKPKLSFVTGGNAKLEKSITTFSLPAGYTCPGASLCKARFDIKVGKIIDGPKAEFRCFAASQEAMYTNVRDSRWKNRELLAKARTKEAMTELLLYSIPKQSKHIRVHVSGDFFNQEYFNAWIDVAVARPDILFYAYTKSLKFWVQRLKDVPDNLVLTASRGGTDDHLIDEYGLRQSVVVFHPDEAKALGLEIDHDDHLAYTKGVDSFALLIHGGQAANSPAGAAIQRLKKEHIEYAYSRE
jgi:hypothetical protein